MNSELSKLKRNKYRKNRQLGMTRTNAAVAAGYSNSIATRRQGKVVVVDFQALFEQKGVTNGKKVEKAIEGMNAMRVTVDKDGRTYESPDWQVRHKWYETMLKLCKQLDAKGGDTNILVIGTLAQRIKEARERETEGIKIKGASLQEGDIVVEADYTTQEVEVTE